MQNLTNAVSITFDGFGNSNFWSSRWTSYVLPAVLAYPILCAAVRFQHMRFVQRKYKYGTSARPTYEDMTDQEAWEIMCELSDYEFPALFEKGLQFALFRTYAVPTISKLLVRTTQLSQGKTVPKRYADTAVLVSMMYGFKPNSEESRSGFGRLNYLHGHYIKQGKISNDDMLYTLSLFMNQPVKWIDRYEWRKVNDLERCAMGVFHKSMGDAMEISYEVLSSYKTGWKDGLQFYDELTQWAEDYEKRVMVPHKDNYNTALQTKHHLMSTLPKFMHGIGGELMAAALDDRLREAIMFDKPNPWYPALLNGFMEARRFYLRHLALPRFFKDPYVDVKPGPNGERWIKRWDTQPFYIKPTMWNRWGPGAWLDRLNGKALPGDKGFHGEGFFVKDIGPNSFAGKGYAEAEITTERLKATRTGGCPFARPF